MATIAFSRVLAALLLIFFVPSSSGTSRARIQKDFPQAVQIYQNGHYCSGAVVDDDIVITAAHCVDSEEGEILVEFHDRVTRQFKIVYDGEAGTATDNALLAGDTRGIKPWRITKELPTVPLSTFYVAFNIKDGCIAAIPVRILGLHVEDGKFIIMIEGDVVPGDSGAPLLNEDMEVVGIVFAYIPFTGTGLSTSMLFLTPTQNLQLQ